MTDTIKAIIKTEEGRGKILPKTPVLGMNTVSQFACSAAPFPGLRDMKFHVLFAYSNTGSAWGALGDSPSPFLLLPPLRGVIKKPL